MKTFVWVIVFFAVGVGIALTETVQLRDHGYSAFTAIAAGATAGGVGASFVFFAVLNVRAALTSRRRRNSKHSQYGVKCPGVKRPGDWGPGDFI
jgi:hypothetical protein